jgi:hypothetical protein
MKSQITLQSGDQRKILSLIEIEKGQWKCKFLETWKGGQEHSEFHRSDTKIFRSEKEGQQELQRIKDEFIQFLGFTEID